MLKNYFWNFIINLDKKVYSEWSIHKKAQAKMIQVLAQREVDQFFHMHVPNICNLLPAANIAGYSSSN